MILSMTGFGRGIAASAGNKFTIEIKSLNSKQLDFTMRAPSFLKELEVATRNQVACRLERGKVDLSVNVEQIGSGSASRINIELLRDYKSQIENLGDRLHLPQPQDWYGLLLHMPDAMHSSNVLLTDDDVMAYNRALEEALSAMTCFRITEGAKLHRFFLVKLENIGRLLESVEPYEKSRVTKIRSRLEEQLAQIESIRYDEGRLEQELIFYIEKLDVSEEKLRLHSHLDYFADTIGKEECRGVTDVCNEVNTTLNAGVGKKLGFIAQEMGREINTLGSKSNNAEMQKIVVEMKDELEQIKEQALNVL